MGVRGTPQGVLFDEAYCTAAHWSSCPALHPWPIVTLSARLTHLVGRGHTAVTLQATQDTCLWPSTKAPAWHAYW